MRGGRKKRLTPKYTPPCPRVTVEPEGFSRAEDFEYSRDSMRPMRSRSASRGELSRSRSRSTNCNDFVVTIDSIEFDIDKLSRRLERGRREAKTRDEHELMKMLQDHLKNMQSVTEEFRDKLRQSQGDSKLKVVVENVKHVLKTEEDVYNYFVR